MPSQHRSYPAVAVPAGWETPQCAGAREFTAGSCRGDGGGCAGRNRTPPDLQLRDRTGGRAQATTARADRVPGSPPIWAMYPQNSSPTPRLRAFIEFLVKWGQSAILHSGGTLFCGPWLSRLVTAHAPNSKGKRASDGNALHLRLRTTCGFADQAHLTFAKYTDVSPGLWRRE